METHDLSNKEQFIDDVLECLKNNRYNVNGEIVQGNSISGLMDSLKNGVPNTNGRCYVGLGGLNTLQDYVTTLGFRVVDGRRLDRNTPARVVTV